MKFTNKKFPKIDSNLTFLLVAILILLGVGMYEVFTNFTKTQKIPIQTQPNPELKNKEYLDILLSKDWYWIETVTGSSVGIKPLNISAFKLKFNKDLTFGSTSDCNTLGGSFEVFENKIKFKDIIKTQMYCMKSNEEDYLDGLSKAFEVSINEKNELLLKFKDSSSFMRFR